MRLQGFIGGSYTLQSVSVDSQRCINLYPELDEEGTGDEGEVASLVGTPGLRLLTTLPTFPIRGSFTDSTGQLWAVGGNVLYKVSSLWVATAFGTLNTSFGPVSFADNGFEAVVVDGAFGYSWVLSALPSTTTVSNGGTITLTASSNPQQIFVTGTGSEILALPDVSTLSSLVGGDTSSMFYIQNLSNGSLTVETSDADLIQVMASGTILVLTCVSNTVGGPTPWNWSYAPNAISGSTFAPISDEAFLGAAQVSFMDSYFIFTAPNSKQFQLSPLNAVTPFSGLDVGTAEASPDNLVGQAVTQEALYLLSLRHMEVWYDSGAANFPFQRIQGAVIQIGCPAAFTIATIQNTVYWLGQDNTGRGVVYSAQGLQPERISTFAIETVIASLGDLSLARAWTYSQSGHAFYCLNLPGAKTTWVFDTSMNLWHERAYLSGGSYSRDPVDTHAFAYNTNVAGDYSSGNLYALDSNVFTHNGNPIVRERAAPHVAKDKLRIFHSSFQLDMEPGVGLSGTGQGTQPRAMLQWSNDGGKKWSNEHWAPIGAIGQNDARTIWRRLGQARNRVYRVRISDPVKVVLIGAEIELEEGAS